MMVKKILVEDFTMGDQPGNMRVLKLIMIESLIEDLENTNASRQQDDSR